MVSQDLGPKLVKQPLSADTPWMFPEVDVSDFNKQMREVAKLIQISKNEEFVEVQQTLHSARFCAAHACMHNVAIL